MAMNPPPYSNITGISRADMKDNAQETLANYNGNARPGELVVDITVDPPTVWVGNSLGQLNAVGGGGGSTTWATLGDKNNASGPSEIALGRDSGTGQGAGSIAIGALSGNTSQGTESVAIGDEAGTNTQGDLAVAIGYQAGQTTQGNETVAIGYQAGQTNNGGVAIGSGAGQTNNGGVAIGYNAGSGLNSIGLGTLAGQGNQGIGAVAIGFEAGWHNQANSAVAVGSYAGSSGQGDQAVAVGAFAAFNGSGGNSIAIGANAAVTGGGTAQTASSIVINATGVNLPDNGANTLTVSPVRNVTSTNPWVNPTNTLPTGFFFTAYNPTTGELIYWS